MGLAGFNRMRRLVAESVDKQPVVVDELAQLRERGKELGIPKASQLGEAKLRVAIEAKEAEIEAATLLAEQEGQLRELREQATVLGIEDVDTKDAETLTAEIEALSGSEE